MKKWMMAVMLAAFCMPAFADKHDGCDGAKCPMMKDGKMMGMSAGMHKGKDARGMDFKKARKEQKAKMKANEEKVEKLVKEYNKLKPGKKKDAKKAEIAAVVASVRAEQIKFKEEHLMQFKSRLERMQKGLESEKSAEAQKMWVDKKTDEVIADEGDLDVLFAPEMPMGRNSHMMMGPGPVMNPPMMDGPMMESDQMRAAVNEIEDN